MSASGNVAGQSSSAVVAYCRQHADLLQASAHTGMGLQLDEYSVHDSAHTYRKEFLLPYHLLITGYALPLHACAEPKVALERYGHDKVGVHG